MSDLGAARAAYAEDLRTRSGVRSARLVRAFATVERERYLGPGPWQILVLEEGVFYQQTRDADPAHLYRDVLVAIEPSRLLNNGQPSAHAMWMDALDPWEGDHVVHVGCATGYYSAILAEVVGRRGRVTAIELDSGLAEQARRNLAHLPQVRVVEADGCLHDPGPADAIYVNAGATHPLPLWLDRLAVGGRMTVPLVRWPAGAAPPGGDGTGMLVKVLRGEAGYRARIVSPVWIFPCIGAVDAEADRSLAEALARGIDVHTDYGLRRDAHPRDAACWLHGDGYCFASVAS